VPPCATMAGGGARWGEVDGYWVLRREHPTRRQEEDEGGEHEDVDRRSWWGEWRRGTKGVRDEGGLRHGGAEGDKAGGGGGRGGWCGGWAQGMRG
jgi:hypothetical protein